MLRYRPLEPLREVGVDDKGAQIGEQWVQLGLEADEQALRVRRIRIQLPKPTRDGDDTICLVTTLSAEQAEAALSGYYMAIEMRNLGESLDTIVDAGDWEPFRRASPQAMAAWLAQQAKRLDLARYRKTGRSTRTPAVKRTHDPGRAHFSVARTLQQRKVKAP